LTLRSKNLPLSSLPYLSFPKCFSLLLGNDRCLRSWDCASLTDPAFLLLEESLVGRFQGLFFRLSAWRASFSDVSFFETPWLGRTYPPPQTPLPLWATSVDYLVVGRVLFCFFFPPPSKCDLFTSKLWRVAPFLFFSSPPFSSPA